MRDITKTVENIAIALQARHSRKYIVLHHLRLCVLLSETTVIKTKAELTKTMETTK